MKTGDEKCSGDQAVLRIDVEAKRKWKVFFLVSFLLSFLDLVEV
jgi:hypothetical protein